MADPSPDAVVEGQEPAADEGQKPADAGDVQQPDAQEAREQKTYTEAYVRQLRSEAAQNRKKLTEVEERLQELTDAEKTEIEKLRERAAALEQEVQDERTQRLRREIVAETGLPPSAYSILTGNTREEIEHRAEELAKLLQDEGRLPTAGFDGGARRTPPEDLAPEQAHNQFLLKALGKEPTRRS